MCAHTKKSDRERETPKPLETLKSHTLMILFDQTQKKPKMIFPAHFKARYAAISANANSRNITLSAPA